MNTTTIRISTRTHRSLSVLANELDLPMSEVVEQAIESLRRQRLLAAANAAYAALRADPEAWKEFQEEDAAWDQTVGDGLEED